MDGWVCMTIKQHETVKKMIGLQVHGNHVPPACTDEGK